MTLKNLKSVLVVAPKSAKGGVKTLVEKVATALELEGIKVVRYLAEETLTRLPIIDFHLGDLVRHISLDAPYDAVLYFGWPTGIGSLVDKMRNTSIIVFVSGHPGYEHLKIIHNSSLSLRTRVGATVYLSYWKFIRKIDIVDLWVCHTITVAEELDLLNHNYVILRQFVLPFEISQYQDFKNKVYSLATNEKSSKVRVFAYLSYADLPGLKLNDLLRIFKYIKRRVKRNVEFFIEDPRQKEITRIDYDIYLLGRMARADFLKLLSTSDLHIETSIDEELRLTSIDAALFSVPVAKITASHFIERQDFTENEVIIAKSVSEFVDKVIEYIENVNYYKDIYSKNIFRFVTTKRIWDAVKEPFLQTLQRLLSI